MKTSTLSFRFIPTALALAVALSAGLACDPGEDEIVERAAPDALPEVDGDPATAPADLPLDQQIAVLAPRKTAAGFLRFTDPAIEDPAAAPLLLARLDSGEDSPAVRAALAEALSRTGADYAAEVAARIPNERDARVREILVFTLNRRADSPDAHPGLVAGLQDDEPAVRAAAARALASRSDGASFGDSLIGLLSDDDAQVRADAARSLGVLKVATATDALAGLLADPSADVRLNSLRAIDRIDPAHARGLDLAGFGADDDERVRRLATRISQR